MDSQFTPEEVINRLCAHHKVEPARLLAVLIKALGRFRLRGFNAFAHLTPAARPDGRPPVPDIHAELQALMIDQDPPLDPATQSVGSIFDAVIMALNYDQWLYEQSADEMQAADAGQLEMSDRDYCACMTDVQHAREDGVLMLVFKECCNQLDAMQIELEIEAEAGR